MLIAGFPAGAFQTNCYVVAPAAGEECVIVDPGQDATEGVDELLREHRLKPVAVLLTHGHLDHVWSVAPVCGARDVPAWIHPDDRHLLSDPAAGWSDTSASLFGGITLSEPDDVRELSDGAVLQLAGLELVVDHTPGHTRGSVSFRLPGDEIMFSGDLLFAGSIGRSDLPGGDYPTILRSLATKCLPLPDDTVVLPGHGPQTTIGRERATNPYLKEAAPHAGPTRGI
ncbi:glyoxylase-like metal-dependent hydrolase (beta-lactamase superfamily II) [Nonomuraea thailandensis]|jgi:glyoxylase-like metal-dependent hydrolase (beta-lactamase superfamily II)|uniref:Glyoxylase-like metal-dependent hydrolase (Beta-lactamase superfamily II) n=1 Tax=Nonomuraea thailandensis TaxID=1188745 RepID=A0A9X2G9V3_9ACTN|nr:MBL fold metallo-hydrolase [Nonomuraea thailandensis]MCP2355082.1 glyoxylase-like metal-dependent hydrolase (beta-lactamase superfamily II) [Nonomuraea thailandensis]